MLQIIQKPARSISKWCVCGPSRGFTLIEMLISVVLVLIVMLLFTQMFQIATESLSKQRGLAENDQRARMLTTLIRGDLEQRTFRDVIPFTQAEDPLKMDLSRRSGYFYYAENDPYSAVDDVLQFTSRVSAKYSDAGAPQYLGKATSFPSTFVNIASEASSPAMLILAGGDYRTLLAFAPHIWVSGSANSSGQSSNDGRFTLSNTPPTYDSGTNSTAVYVVEDLLPMANHGRAYITERQPEMDDGIASNQLGQSPAAEISYFLRGTNLHRRVLLIRDVDGDVNPSYMNGAPLISTYPSNGTYPSGPPFGVSPSFWGDFDYSAFYSRGKYNGSALIGAGPRFNSLGLSLDNSNTAEREIAFNSPPSVPLSPSDQFRKLSLGCPQLRFGHDPCTGLPREFTGTGAGVDFIGRFTLMECSNPAFGYPGRMLSIPNPSDPTKDVCPMSTNAAITLDANNNVVEYASSPNRRGEDIVMTNVISFDVKIWDQWPSVYGFVDLGDDNATVTYSSAKLLNSYYCPTTSTSPSKTRYRYDTWHPNAEAVNASGSPTLPNGSPPFKNVLDPEDINGVGQLPLRAIQITLTYRDRSSDLVRQLTIVQSLIDERNR